MNDIVSTSSCKFGDLELQLGDIEILLPGVMLAELKGALPCDRGYPHDWYQVAGNATFPADHIRES